MYPYLPLKIIKKYEKIADLYNVARVCRGIDKSNKTDFGFLEIYKSLKKNPEQFIKLLPTFLESMITTAELSKYKVNGFKGAIRLKGLMLIYFITFFQWMDDKESSLEKTMTALDKNLDQAEKLSKLFL